MKEVKIMAIFHCRIQIIGRSSGRSVVAAAAYRAGERLEDLEVGKVSDYSHRKDVVYSAIDLPLNAPDQFQDRSTLWNAVQRKESKKNAQLAREIEVALPIELDLEAHIEILKEYVQKDFVDEGMIADWSIHNKDGNPHAHILLTLRGFKDNGDWDVKERKIYKLDEAGEKIPIIDPLTKKQKTDSHGRKQWLRETVQANDWNDPSNVEIWRSDWADICNQYLVEKDIEPIDHRSFKRQGLDIEPTIHEGWVARQIEARGGMSERCETNREIIERRNIIEYLKDIAREIKDLLMEKIERIKHGRIGRDSGANTEIGRNSIESAARVTTEESADFDTFIAELEAQESAAAEARADRNLISLRPKLNIDFGEGNQDPVDVGADRIDQESDPVDRGFEL